MVKKFIFAGKLKMLFLKLVSSKNFFENSFFDIFWKNLWEIMFENLFSKIYFLKFIYIKHFYSILLIFVWKELLPFFVAIQYVTYFNKGSSKNDKNFILETLKKIRNFFLKFHHTVCPILYVPHTKFSQKWVAGINTII